MTDHNFHEEANEAKRWERIAVRELQLFMLQEHCLENLGHVIFVKQ